LGKLLHFLILDAEIAAKIDRFIVVLDKLKQRLDVFDAEAKMKLARKLDKVRTTFAFGKHFSSRDMLKMHNPSPILSKPPKLALVVPVLATRLAELSRSKFPQQLFSVLIVYSPFGFVEKFGETLALAEQFSASLSSLFF
jgi:hypothetical protein